MTWAAIAVGVGSAVVGAVGAKQASDAQSRGARGATQDAREARNMAYTAYEPNRMLGYQAGADLASLYGYATPGYTPLNQLLSGNTTGVYGTSTGTGGGNSLMGNNAVANFVDPLRLSNGGKGANVMNILDGAGLFGLGGDSNAPYTASINTNTGTVDVKGGHNNLDAQMTAYLRGTGPEPTGGHGRYSEIKNAIKQLHDQGYTYTPGANGAAGTGAMPGAIPATPAGQPGNMSRFFTSPDYQFRLSEGTRAIDRSAAARGGALSGNALRAQTGYASNLAAGEYGNYVNRLLAMMGMGQTATQGTVQAAQNYGNQSAQNSLYQGDARASGISGMYGAGLGLLNSLGGLYGSGRLGSGSSTPSYGGMSPELRALVGL